MGGIHKFSSDEFIQSGSVAQFLDGIEAIGSSPVHGLNTTGILTANSFDGLSTEPTPSSLILYALNADGNELITSANVGDTISIYANGDFDNFCFVKNIDDGVAGEIIVGNLNGEPEDLNEWEPSEDYPKHSSFQNPYSYLNDNDNDTGIVYLDQNTYTEENPFFITNNFDSSIIISRYLKVGYDSTSHQFTSWEFQGSNNNFNTFDVLHTVEYDVDIEYDSEDINNTTPYTSYRFKFISTDGYPTLYELSLFSKPFTTTPSTPSGRWTTVEKGDSNGLYKKDFIDETYDTADIYEYLVIANNRITNKTVVEGITITIT